MNNLPQFNFEHAQLLQLATTKFCCVTMFEVGGNTTGNTRNNTFQLTTQHCWLLRCKLNCRNASALHRRTNFQRFTYDYTSLARRLHEGIVLHWPADKINNRGRGVHLFIQIERESCSGKEERCESCEFQSLFSFCILLSKKEKSF